MSCMTSALGHRASCGSGGNCGVPAVPVAGACSVPVTQLAAQGSAARAAASARPAPLVSAATGG